MLDTQYTHLQRRLSETRDFEAIQKFHEDYLDALISQSFLHVKAISKSLEQISTLPNLYLSNFAVTVSEILQLCLELCNVMARAEHSKIDFIKINELKKVLMPLTRLIVSSI